MTDGAPMQEIGPGLYLLGASPSPGSPSVATYTYFLAQTAPSPSSPPPTAQEAWEEIAGWFLFLTEPVVDGAGFAAAGRAQLPPLSTASAPVAILWMPGPDAFADADGFQLYGLGGHSDNRTLAPGSPSSVTFSWSALTLTIAVGSRFSYDLTNDAVSIVATVQQPPYIVLSTGTPAGLDGFPYSGTSTSTWSISVPLVGRAAGSFCMTAALPLAYLVQSLDCGFRYFLGEGEPESLYYAFLPPLALFSAPSQSEYYGFALQLHPLLQTDPAFTMLALDLGPAQPNPYQQNSAALTAPYFTTSGGGTLTLAPFDVSGDPMLLPPGFAFHVGPGASTASQLYLAPAGTYEVAAISTAGGSPATSAQWQCGLSAQEFLSVEVNDLVTFVPGMPAYAPSVGGSEQRSGPALDPTFTTSWAQFPTGADAAPRAYFGQASASTYYAGSVGDVFGVPVTSQLMNLTAPATFPLVPYGGIYASLNSVEDVPVFNASNPPQSFAAFESLALTSTRHAAATLGSSGPIFTLPVSSGSSTDSIGTPPPMQSALTPQGLVANLNSDGTWAGLDFAVNPLSPSRFLSFDGSGTPPVVGAAISNVILQNELFLVVSDAASLGAFSNQIGIGGFNFTLDVGPSSPGAGDGTLLIFKYNTTRSLEELAQKSSLWAAAATFVLDVGKAQDQIREAIETARNYHSGSGGNSPAASNPFANFLSIVADPQWSGILALNCAIDGNGMPSDFQMLLGGINGQLRAHHFGVERNRVAQDPDLGPTLVESSLFGVVHYVNPPVSPRSPAEEPALEYEVETLTVTFFNSQITTFDVVVGLTINSLFGRETLLLGGGVPTPPLNTLEIAGQYQQTGAVGTVTFATSEPFIFQFPALAGAVRVLDYVRFDSATLVPVSSQVVSPNATVMTSQFTLAGGLWFASAPFPNAGDFDLFSYGNGDGASGGLAFTGMTVEIVFTLDEGGAMVPGSKSVTFLPALLQLQSSLDAVRDGSLLAALPLQLSSFSESSSGMTPALLGATPVNCLQLEGSASASSGGAGPANAPYVTAAPQFALVYDLPLGSLGSLSSVNAGLTAKLVIGWGPSSIIPESDAAAVLVQLPQLSAGYGGFQLEGLLTTTFGDANLLAVDVDNLPVYALLLSNVQLSILGFKFPPGVIIDFLLFAGQPQQAAVTNTANLAWFVGAQTQGVTA